MLAKSQGREAIANRVCRIIMSQEERISALTICKWVEWRYGKAKEQTDFSHNIGRVITVEEAKAIARDMLGRYASDDKTLTIEPDHNGTDPSSASG